MMRGLFTHTWSLFQGRGVYIQAFRLPVASAGLDAVFVSGRGRRPPCPHPRPRRIIFFYTVHPFQREFLAHFCLGFAASCRLHLTFSRIA